MSSVGSLKDCNMVAKEDRKEEENTKLLLLPAPGRIIRPPVDRIIRPPEDRPRKRLRTRRVTSLEPTRIIRPPGPRIIRPPEDRPRKRLRTWSVTSLEPTRIIRPRGPRIIRLPDNPPPRRPDNPAQVRTDQEGLRALAGLSPCNISSLPKLPLARGRLLKYLPLHLETLDLT